ADLEQHCLDERFLGRPSAVERGRTYLGPPRNRLDRQTGKPRLFEDLARSIEYRLSRTWLSQSAWAALRHVLGRSGDCAGFACCHSLQSSWTCGQAIAATTANPLSWTSDRWRSRTPVRPRRSSTHQQSPPR